MILVPSAFTVPTGSAHWEVLLRARAIEAQAYVIASAQVISSLFFSCLDYTIQDTYVWYRPSNKKSVGLWAVSRRLVY